MFTLPTSLVHRNIEMNSGIFVYEYTFNPNRAIENQKSLERLIIATLGVWT